jgi:hypothetical protein
MRRSVGAGLALVGAGAALAFSPVGGKLAQAVLTGPQAKPGAPNESVPARVPPSAANPAPAQPPAPAAPAQPALTEAQRAAARGAVAHDASLSALAGGTSYRITDAVPWTDPSSGDVVGADVTVTYSAPVGGTATLPGARFDAAGATYRRLQYRLRVSALTQLHAMVDLREGGQVVDVEPEDGSVEELPGNPHFSAQDEGGR